MNQMNQKVALTLHLPIKLYEEMKIIAQKEKKSFNNFICELLEEKIKKEKRKDLFQAFFLVAEDGEEADVAYAFEAQREVVLRDE